MENRTLDITLIAAKGLKNVNLFSKVDVYAVVSIAGGDPRAKQKTPVDKEGNTNPNWNFPMKFTVDETAVQQNRLTLVVNLRAERALGDKDVGEVRVPIKDLMGEHKSVQFVRYQVRKPSGRPKGELYFSYKFSERVAGAQVTAKAEEPVTAYPAPPVASGPSSAYPPPYSSAGASTGYYPPPAGGYPPSAYPPSGYQQPAPAAAGYGYPQPAPAATGYGYPQPAPAATGYGYPQPAPAAAGYGYPPAQAYGGYPPPQPPHGYGYQPQQGYGYPPVQQPPKKNKFGGGGAGLGLGLLGGALGGMLIGDMISDAGSYDAGFDDAGGFDF